MRKQIWLLNLVLLAITVALGIKLRADWRQSANFAGSSMER